jgi:hypothetical protein
LPYLFVRKITKENFKITIKNVLFCCGASNGKEMHHFGGAGAGLGNVGLCSGSGHVIFFSLIMAQIVIVFPNQITTI